MSSRLVIQITVPDSIAEMNEKVQELASNPGRALEKLIQYLKNGIRANNDGITLEVTTRDSAVTVNTSGTDSTKNTHTIL